MRNWSIRLLRGRPGLRFQSRLGGRQIDMYSFRMYTVSKPRDVPEERLMMVGDYVIKTLQTSAVLQ